MRTDKELLKILLVYYTPNTKEYYYLCWTVKQMYNENLITSKEKVKLLHYIVKHRPKRGKFYCSAYHDVSAFWPFWFTNIRIEWLKYQIKKCKT